VLSICGPRRADGRAGDAAAGDGFPWKSIAREQAGTRPAGPR
jgi:hypothetical protein